MEPRIQYAKTADGVNIAFMTVGRGPPVVLVTSTLVSHVQLEWQQPVQRAVYESVAARRTLIRFDMRGSGLSDRDVDDISLEASIRDLEAVVDHLKLEPFVLAGIEPGAATAIMYAVRNPERVSHLLLLDAFARGADATAMPQMQALWELAKRDWEMFTETVGAFEFGYRREEGKQYGDLVANSITRETLLRWIPVWEATDISDLLPHIAVPTLVLRHSGHRFTTMEMARELAARIPNARMVVLEGMWADSADQMMRALVDFLGGGEEVATPATVPSGLVSILFTDIEGSTTLTQRLGDAKAQELIRTHNTIVRDALKAHAGTEIKHTGDGIMASFPSASQALQCAMRIQQAVEAWNRDVGAALAPPQGAASSAPTTTTTTPFRVRVGLNAGEPVAEEQDLFGTAVQLARRVCDHARPGQILVSDVVRQLAMGKGFLFSDHGDVELRGFEDPVRLYEVRWQE